MSSDAPPDWPALLGAQGVDQAVIAAAQSSAASLAATALAVPHDPKEPLAPADLVGALVASLSETDAP